MRHEMLSCASLVSVLLVACEPHPPESIVAEEKTSEHKAVGSFFVQREVLVKFKSDVSQKRINEVLKESGTELITVLSGLRIHQVRIVGQETVDAVVKKLSALDGVEYAEPNFRLQSQ